MKMPLRKNKRLWIALVTFGVVAILGVAFVVVANPFGKKSMEPSPAQQAPARKVNDVDYSPPSDQDKAAQDQQKDEIIKQQDQGGATTPPAISVSISRASQADASQPLIIRTIVSGTTTGTCDVTATKSGQSAVTKTFSVSVEATYSTCDGAEIAASDFPASGTWNIQVIVKSGSASSAAATQDVTVTK